MAKEEIYITTVRLNTEEAKNKLDELVKKEKSLRQEYEKALSSNDSEAIKKTAAELKKARKELSTFKAEIVSVDEILDNLSSASISQLNKAAKSLSNQMRNLATDTQEFADKQKQLKKIKERLAEIKEEGKAVSRTSLFGRGFDFLNKNWGAITQTVQAITGLSATIRSTTEAYSKMEEAMADVQKYTGQTTEEVHAMNEEFKKIDTRTSRERLNALAGDAGRLGITGKDAIMEFVDAADKIEVALGDDLGSDAVKNIGKLAETFGDSDKMGLRGAMLATGSAVNELAQSSSAAAGYIVNFEARFAGLGNQAHMVQSDIMGLAAVLDQNMQQEETSSTALAQLMTKMYSEPQKFAQLAGKSVEEFSRLLKEDANEALLTFLDSMRSKGGFDSLAPMFDEMGLSGVRCVGVLSTLATNLDEVKRQQKIASDAFAKGTSVLDEFNVQNNTVQAEVDKAKKKFQDLSIELGQKLLPVVKYTVSGTSLLVKSLSVLINFFVEYKSYIIATTAALLSYYAVMKSEAIWAAFTKGVQTATTAIKGFSAAIKSNPWGLVVTMVALATAGFIEYRKKVKAAKEEAEELDRVEREALLTYSKEAAEIKALDKILHDETISINKRREALDKLKQIIPGYNALLSEEGRLTRDNRQAIEDYLISLEKQIKLKAYQDKLQELYAKQADLNETRDEQSKKYWDTRMTNTLQGYDRNSLVAKISRAFGTEEESNMKKALDKTDDALGEIDGKINSLLKNIASVSTEASKISTGSASGGGSTGSGGGGSAGSGGGGSAGSGGSSGSNEDPTKKALDQSRAIAKQQNAINEAEYATGMKLKAEFEKRKYEITLEELDRELAIYKKGTEEYANALAERQKVTAQQMHANNELQEQEIIAQADAVAKKLQMAFVDPTSEIYQNQAALDRALFENTVDALAKRRDLYAVTSQEYADLDAQILEEDNNNKLRLAKEYSDKVEQFKKEWLKKSDEEQKNETIRFLEELHSKGLVSEEQYQQMLKDIREKYDKAKVEENKFLAAVGDPIGIVDSFTIVKDSVDALSEKIKDGKAEWLDYAAVGATALQQVSGMISSISDLYAANCELEIAQTEAKYDKEIKAAGNNQAKVKRLEEQKKRDTNKIKIKQIDADAKAGIAQALINTALSVTKGYADYGPILGSVLAAISVAMGAIQVATISKQAQAQKTAMQYYEGGYTGGSRYRKEAGIVHEGEFVANHFAVNNPAVSPVLDLIDYAQRNNTVGSLTRSDIVGAAGGGGQSQVVAPIVNVSSDNPELRENLARLSEAVELFKARLDEPIEAKMSMDRFDDDYRYYQRLKNSK